MPDQWEREHGFDPNTVEDKDEDADGDGITNRDEWEAGTNPNNPDSDGDGYPDGWEMANGFDPQDDNDGGPVYVSATGNDGNKGTQGSPYLTLAKAVWKASYGLTDDSRTVRVVGELSEASGNVSPIQDATFGITDTGKNGVIISGTGTDPKLTRSSTRSKRILYVGPNTRLTLQDITLTGGNSERGSGIYVESGELILGSGSAIINNIATGGVNGVGGGILVEYGKLTMLKGALISNNKATNHSGGGVYLQNSEFIMEGGVITENTTVSEGGGLCVYSRSKAVLKNGAEISGNTAHRAGGGVAVISHGELILEEGSKITGNFSLSDTNNTAYGAGGITLSQGSLLMKGGEISGNTTDGLCGGVGLYWYSTFTMEGGRIAGNTAATYGGGVGLTTQASFIMKGGFIEGNKGSRGGGVWLRNDTTNPFTMTGGTIYGSDNAEKGNTATAANGGHALYDGTKTPAGIVNNTITSYP
jgi:hypothetical protein